MAPAVLEDLAKVDARLSRAVGQLKQSPRRPIDDGPALERWAKRSGLNAPWVIVAGRNTIALWRAWPARRGKVWDLNLHEEGELVPERGRLPRRPAELLLDPEHFDWLVRRRVLRVKYLDITTPAQTSQRAVSVLARRLGL